MPNDKISTSVSLERRFVNRMDEENRNRSEFINNLLERYYEGKDMVDEAVASYRLHELDLKERARKAELEAVRKEKEHIQERQRSQRNDDAVVLEEAADVLRPQQLTPDNDAVQSFARDTTMDVDEFIQELEDRL